MPLEVGYDGGGERKKKKNGGRSVGSWAVQNGCWERKKIKEIKRKLGL